MRRRPSLGLGPTVEERAVDVATDGVVLPGELALPERPSGVVLFAHGSGSSRRSPRNRYVARVLHEAGLATLLFDLLTADEEERDRVTGHLRFDIERLTTRLVGATDWVATLAETRALPIGYFGASTGAAAALVAAAERPAVAAVVSRGGRPDLAGPALEGVRAPVLLLVGGNDPTVLALNREVMAKLPGEHELAIVQGATHLFQEAGALASYRYKTDESSAAPHLGFLIDDVEPSAAVSNAHGDTVDLHGYASMAVAAIQTQVREIEALKREVPTLRRLQEEAARQCGK